MSQNSYYNTENKKPECQICKIKNEPLIQLGDYVYLCSLCNTKRGKHWTFSDAWKERYSTGYKNKSSNKIYESSDKCWYCGSLYYLVDIFGKKHPNPIHRYQGHYECEYCRYDREVVIPRHGLSMEKKQQYDREYFHAYTFRSEGSSGIDPDKVLARIRDEREQRAQDYKRRCETFARLVKIKSAADKAESEQAAAEAEANEEREI